MFLLRQMNGNCDWTLSAVVVVVVAVVADAIIVVALLFFQRESHKIISLVKIFHSIFLLASAVTF